MRFGLFGGALRTRGGTYREAYDAYVEYVVAAEGLGYESVFLVEHHFTGLGDVGASLTLLSNLAARTTTMRLGTAVTVLPWYVPTMLAEQAALVDVLSGGRLDFGVGRGYRPNEFHGFCIDPGEARARFDECLELLERSWTSTERFSHDGTFWKFRDIVVEPKPAQHPHPPIWVAALSEASVKEAATRGHKLLLDQFSDVELTAQRIEWYRTGCESAGRVYRPDDVAVTRGLLVLPSDDHELRAAEVARRGHAIRRTADSARIPGSAPLGPQDHAFFNDSPEAIEGSAILGTPDECFERLLALRAVGVEYVLFSDLHGSAERLRLFADEVMPHLQ